MSERLYGFASDSFLYLVGEHEGSAPDSLTMKQILHDQSHIVSSEANQVAEFNRAHFRLFLFGAH